MKRLVSLILALIMLFCIPAFVISCAEKNEQGTVTDESGNQINVDRKITIAENGKSDYRIVYPTEFKNRERSAATDLQSYIESVAGIKLDVVTDSESATAHEILIGATNRTETAKANSELDGYAYVVKAVDEKLVVVASKEKYYDTAFNYIKYNNVEGNAVVFYSGLNYLGSEITSFLADEKVDGKTQINITVTPYSKDCRTGIFVGKQKDGYVYGYKGYMALLEKNAITLYEMNKTLEPMASRKIKTVKAGDTYKLRVNVNSTSISVFLLDDAEGVEPWPEIELKTLGTNKADIGFVELSGYGAKYEDFTVAPTESSGEKVSKYTNAIYAGYADPEVYYEDGTYYLYATGGEGYRVHTSKDLVNWKAGGIVVSPNLWGVTRWYWAPDVEKIGDKYYMVVSCDEQLGIAVADSPLGPFKEHSKSVLYKKSIDGHIFVDDDGKIYLYFVSWRSTYGIYGVELNKNMEPVAGTEKLLITPNAPWEQDQGNVTEGPYMLKHNGTYYLTYSGSHYQSIYYAVGYATSKSPLGTFKKYSLNPIMVGNTQIHGTGHHCITLSPSGNEMIIVYHCHNDLEKVNTRRICIDRIRFAPVAGDIDRLEVYGPSVVTQPYPQ